MEGSVYGRQDCELIGISTFVKRIGIYAELNGLIMGEYKVALLRYF